MTRSHLRVLLVEDVQVSRTIVARMLHNLGVAEVVEAEDGIEALYYIERRGGFDLVVLDIHMPGMNGIQFLETVRSGRPAGVDPFLPIIILTSEEDEAMVRTACSLGVDAYLVKPVDAERMREKLDAAVRERKGLP